MINFSKYQGLGNDFIIIDDRFLNFPFQDRSLIQRVCHRQLGIGADGLILLGISDAADYKMRIFNCDGREAKMCGNGLRCLVAFIRDSGLCMHSFTIETKSFIHTCSFLGDEIAVDLGPPKIFPKLDLLKLSDQTGTLYHFDTGVPHGVIFVSDLDQKNLMLLGEEIRNHSVFSPDGINVNFVKILSSSKICMRTFERGVESETMACGTGAAAAALAAYRIFGMKEPVQVFFVNNEALKFQIVECDSKISNISMIGPASPVFSGTINF